MSCQLCPGKSGTRILIGRMQKSLMLPTIMNSTISHITQLALHHGGCLIEIKKKKLIQVDIKGENKWRNSTLFPLCLNSLIISHISLQFIHKWKITDTDQQETEGSGRSEQTWTVYYDWMGLTFLYPTALSPTIQPEIG